MDIGNPSLAGKVFWALAAIGFLLPWMVIISCEIYFDQAEAIKHFPEQLFASGYNFFLVAVMNSLPFIVLALLAKWTLKSPKNQATYIARLVGLITAGASVLGISVFVQVGVWGHVFNPKVHASLAGIAIYLLLPVALGVLLIAGGFGWGVTRASLALGSATLSEERPSADKRIG